MRSLVQALRRRLVDALQRGLFDEPVAADTPTTTTMPVLPTQTPSSATSPTPTATTDDPLRHPRATRTLVLDGRAVHFLLRRSRRRTIGFVVGGDGLVVSAPAWVRLRDVDAAVAEKARWILAKLDGLHERRTRAAAAQAIWRDGGTVRYLGADIAIVLDRRHGLASGEVELDRGTTPASLHVGLPRCADEARVRDAVQSWLQREARRVFAERSAHFAERLGVRVTRLSLSSAKTRWGSASADGSVRLHWRLVHHPLATIDYVVAHELAHLREMNHGPRFWAVVGSVVPDVAAARKRLRDEAALQGPLGL